MKQFLKLLFNILTPKERNRLFIMAGGDLLTGIADVVFLAGLLLIIRAYTNAPALTGSAFAGYYDRLTHADPVLVTGLFLVLFCLKNLAGVWLSKNQHHFVYDVASRLSQKNMMAYLRGSYADFVNVDSSVQIRQISQVPIEFSHYILTNFQLIISEAVLILFTISAILYVHPALFVLLLLLLFPPVILLGWFIKSRLKKIRGQIKINSARVIQHLQESLAGYVEANIYGKNEWLAGRYNRHQQQMNNNIAAQQTLQGLSSRFIEVFAVFGFFVLIVINKWFAGTAIVDVLTIGIFMAAAYKIIPGMVKILNSAGQIKTYSFALHDLAKEQTTAQDLAQAKNEEPIRSVKFENIYFKYQDKPVINGLSFEIASGDFAGISGISGSGKTTMINLLSGFLEQEAGTVYVNDKTVDTDAKKAFRNRISYIKQQSFFINDTILKNITLCDDEPRQERLARALDISGLDIFLSEYHEGIHKMLNEHGKNISGGQRQRVSLARALYHDFDLLIMDEPFSEMDHDAEQVILNRIKQISEEGKMVLLITHNRQSLSVCNKIISPNAL